MPTRYALPSGECSMFLPKSTKCGAPIFTGPMNFAGSGKSGFSGESGEGVHVLP